MAMGKTKQETVKEEVKETVKAGRKGAGEVAEPKAPIVTTIKVGMFGSKDDFWYRNREGNQFSMVTTDSKNFELGIRSVNLYPPNESQAGRGVLARVQLELGTEHVQIGVIRGITIRESKKTPGAIYLQTGSRNIAQEGQDAKWYNEVTVSREVECQILSYVDTLLVANN